MTDDARSRWSWETALSGVVPPLISPLGDEGPVDRAGLEALIDHLLRGGVSGLFVLGGCGEGAWLTTAQRGLVIGGSVRAAAGRAPVLAGVMLPATGPATEAARQAEAEGADAVVVGSPYYFAVDADAQRRHVEAVMGATRLPALLYNIPQCTHHTLAPATVAALAGDPRVLGIKDSAGDFAAFQGFLAVARRYPAFRVLQGNEPLCAASLFAGGDGLVPGMANVAPSLFVELCRAARAGDVARARAHQTRILELSTLLAHGHWLPALKAACATLGLGGGGRPAPPLAPATAAQREAIAAILARLDLLGAPTVPA